MNHSDLFLKQEWLDIISENSKIKMIELSFKNSHLIAAFVQKTYGPFHTHTCAEFTPHNIKIFHEIETTNAYSIYSKEVKLLELLDRELNTYSRVKIKFPLNFYTLSPLLGSYSKAYWATTCWIPSDTKIDSLWHQIHAGTRNHIQSGQKDTAIIEDAPLETIYNLILENPYYAKSSLSLHKLTQIKQYLDPLQSFKTFSVQDPNQHIIATAILIRSENVWYFWMNATDKQFQNRESNSILIWRAIEFAINLGCHFHFDGSMVPSIEKVFKSFTSETKPYCYLVRSQNVFLRLWDAFNV